MRGAWITAHPSPSTQTKVQDAPSSVAHPHDRHETYESRRKTLQTEVGPSVPKVAPRPPTRYDASVCHRDGSNGFTHIPGTHLDDPRRKQRLCSPARVAVRRAPSDRPRSSLLTYIINSSRPEHTKRTQGTQDNAKQRTRGKKHQATTTTTHVVVSTWTRYCDALPVNTSREKRAELHLGS